MNPSASLRDGKNTNESDRIPYLSDLNTGEVLLRSSKSRHGVISGVLFQPSSRSDPMRQVALAAPAQWIFCLSVGPGK